MAEHTYPELAKMTVAQLRDIAKEAEVEGASQMNKEHVLEAVCKALNIDMHVHHHVEGVDKAKIKGRIKELKARRREVMHEPGELKLVRRQIHSLKRKLHKAMV